MLQFVVVRVLSQGSCAMLGHEGSLQMPTIRCTGTVSSQGFHYYIFIFSFNSLGCEVDALVLMGGISPVQIRFWGIWTYFFMFPDKPLVPPRVAVMLPISLHIPQVPVAVLHRAKATQELSAYLTEECKWMSVSPLMSHKSQHRKIIFHQKPWPAGHCPSASLFQLFQESQQTLTHHLFQVGQQMIPLSSFRFFKSVAFLTGKIYTEQISF